jgi:hypothetical protein
MVPAQVDVQPPFWQMDPFGQARLQPPQLSESELVSTQMLPHGVNPELH